MDLAVASTCSVVTIREGDPPRVTFDFRLLTSGTSNSESQLFQLALDRGTPQRLGTSHKLPLIYTKQLPCAFGITITSETPEIRTMLGNKLGIFEFFSW